MSVTWELVRRVSSRTLSQPYCLRNSGGMGLCSQCLITWTPVYSTQRSRSNITCALELSHSLVSIFCFPLQTMLRIRLFKKNCLCLHTFIHLETNHRHTTWEGTGKRHSISFLKLASEVWHSHEWYNVQSRPLGRHRYSSWNSRMASVYGSLHFEDYLLFFFFPTGIR